MAPGLMAQRPADRRPVRAADPAAGSGARPAACRLRAAAHLFLAAAAAAPKAQGSPPAVQAAERDAAAVLQPAGVAVWAAAAEQAPLEAAVGSGAAAERQPEAAALSDAVAVPQPEEVAVSDAVEARQPVEAVVLDAAARQPVAQGVLAAFRASAAGLSFPSLFAFPFPGLSAPGSAACFAHVRQSLRIASRTERSRQATRDEIWSWRYGFPESSKG
jgi:hypothetical protein